MAPFLRVLSGDQYKKPTKQNFEKSSTSVSSFMCFLSSDMVLDDSSRLQRAKNLPQRTLPFSHFSPERKTLIG